MYRCFLNGPCPVIYSFDLLICNSFLVFPDNYLITIFECLSTGFCSQYFRGLFSVPSLMSLFAPILLSPQVLCIWWVILIIWPVRQRGGFIFFNSHMCVTSLLALNMFRDSGYSQISVENTFAHDTAFKAVKLHLF